MLPGPRVKMFLSEWSIRFPKELAVSPRKSYHSESKRIKKVGGPYTIHFFHVHYLVSATRRTFATAGPRPCCSTADLAPTLPHGLVPTKPACNKGRMGDAWWVRVHRMTPNEESCIYMCIYIYICATYVFVCKNCYTSSTAQGGGGSFRRGNLQERLVVVNHGWQSESTD